MRREKVVAQDQDAVWIGSSEGKYIEAICLGNQPLGF